jgi:choline dehydrogenase-like flavoprotein
VDTAERRTPTIEELKPEDEDLRPPEERLRRFLRVNALMFALFGLYWALDALFKADGTAAPLAVNAIAKDALLTILALTAVANIRRFSAHVTLLIAAHVVIVCGLVVLLLVALFGDFSTRGLLLFFPGVWSTVVLIVWLLLASGMIAQLAALQHAALRDRFGLHYLSPTAYRTTVALAEALIEGPREEVSPERIAHNVDGYLSELESEGKKRLHVALLALYLYSIPFRGVPLTALTPQDRARLLRSRFPETFSTSGIRVIRMVEQAMIRAGQQLVFAGYYGDPTSYPSTGYTPFSERGRDTAPLKRQPTGLKAIRGQLDGVGPVDVIVVGSGAGGAIVAHELVEAGAHVLMIERGHLVEPRTFEENEVRQLSRLYSDGALQLSRDFRLSILQGMCVGGSTVVNNAVCFDLPDRVLDRWSDPDGLNAGLCRPRLAKSFSEVRALIGVREQGGPFLNPGARWFRDGVAKLDLPYEVKHAEANIHDCLGCGYCNIGCAYGRKLSMLDTVLPETQKNGGSGGRGTLTLVSECLVDHIEPGNGKVTVVARNQSREELRASADRVVVCAGAIASSQILKRSRIPNRSIGDHLSFNISTPITADFGPGHTVDSFAGLQISDYLEPPGDSGFVLETWFNPVLTQSLVMPGWFRDHFENMLRYPNMTCGGVLVGTRAYGALKNPWLGGGPVRFRPAKEDFAAMVDGLKLLGRIFLRAGAERVMPSTFRYHVFREEPDLSELDAYVTDNADLYLASSHPQGGNVMSATDKKGVVDERFRVYGAENVYVCDASVFPSSVTVNPQLTVMAMAHYAAACIKGEDPHLPGCGCGS